MYVFVISHSIDPAIGSGNGNNCNVQKRRSGWDVLAETAGKAREAADLCSTSSEIIVERAEAEMLAEIKSRLDCREDKANFVAIDTKV